MATIIPFILIIISLALIITIVVKKYPQLTLLDVDTITEAKEDKKKNEFIKKRAIKRIEKSKTDWKVMFEPLARSAKQQQLKFRNYVGRVQKKVEEEMNKREDVHEVSQEDIGANKDKAISVLKQAKHALDNHQYEEAEKLFIQVIRLDQKNKEAYRGLGDVYFAQEQFPEAEETYKFLTKLCKKDASIYVRLADIAEAKRDFVRAAEYLGHATQIDSTRPEKFMRRAELLLKADMKEQAFEVVQRAVELEPENPKYIDKFIETSIIVGNKKLAEDGLKQLIKVNSENNKIEEFGEEIKNMV